VVLEALLWLLRNGGRWQDLPDWTPSESTCRRRLKRWTEQGLLTEVWSRLVGLADELGRIDWEHLIADGTFCRAKKGEISSASAAKGTAQRPWSSWTATARPWAW
jgi:transposase